MKLLNTAFILILLLFVIITVPRTLPEKADIVIIGAGGAGMRAALESIKISDRVILLEKMPYPGGNASKATAGFNAVTEEKDVNAFISDTKEAGLFSGNPQLIRLLAEHSGSALKDLRQMGADLQDRGLLAGHSESRTYRPSGGKPVGREISAVLYNSIRNRGIDIRLENEALSITRKSSWEVLVKNRTGREYRIRCDAVIIATGGFGGSPERVIRYNPDLKGFHTTNTAGATGDFLNLTSELPVKLIDLEEIQTHPTVEPEYSILITEALRGNGSILVNSEGQRFTDEMDFRESLSQTILEQKGRSAWLIFDQTVRRSLNSSEYYISNQLTRIAESPEELSVLLSVPERALTETMARWTRSVLQGKDDDFYREDLRVPLDEPPYYAIRVTPGIHYCMGGLAIDGKARVLDLDGNPMEGLYAAGEATGGIHGKDRLGGNSLTDAMVFGKIAGHEAALYAVQGQK